MSVISVIARGAISAAHILKEDLRFFVPVMDYFSAEERKALFEAEYDFDRWLFHELYRKKVSART